MRPRSADQPVLIHAERISHRSNVGLTSLEQFRAGRYEVFSSPDETIERAIRGQLAGMLGEEGFDPARGIEAMRVNRWAHGYGYRGNSLIDTYDDDNDDDDRYPNVRRRKPLGRIRIANSDAAAKPLLVEAAVDQACRADGEPA
jgi:spermidine dehydrogenase